MKFLKNDRFTFSDWKNVASSVVGKVLLLLIILLVSSCDPDDPGMMDTVITVNAGEDQLVDFGNDIVINGIVSISPSEEFTYDWQLIEKPADSSVELVTSNEAKVEFTPDELGEYVFKLTGKGESGIEASDEVVITVQYAPIVLNGLEVSDRILVNVYEDPSLADYIVTNSYIVGDELSIDPDVRIVFAQDANLIVKVGGAIVANGEMLKPIIFTGVQKSRGFWQGLVIESKDPRNKLDHSIVEYAGGNVQSNPSNIKIDDAIIEITNSTIQEGLAHGIAILGSSSQIPLFENNIINKNQAPILCRLNHLNYLNGANDYSQNTDDFVETYRSDDVEEDINIQQINVPYLIPTFRVRFAGDIAIEAGVEIVSKQGGGLDFVQGSSLSAIGTSDLPITFRGINDSRGIWQGIRIQSNETKNELTYVQISNGGESKWNASGDQANITIWTGGRTKISNVTSRNSQGFGLLINHNNVVLSEFLNNTFTENEVSARMTYDQYKYLDATSSFTGNDKDYIETVRSENDTEIDGTWRKLDVPYRLVSETFSIKSAITVEPGVIFLGVTKSSLTIDDEGSLFAEGTISDPIQFIGSNDVQGYWKGLRFSSNSVNNVLSHVIVSNGGEFAWSGSKSNIRVEGKLVLEDSFISTSAGYGVFVGLSATLSEMNNTFEGNALEDIYYQ